MRRTSPASVNARRTSYTAWWDTVESQVRPMAGPTLLSLVTRSAIVATLLDRDLRDIFIDGEQLHYEIRPPALMPRAIAQPSPYNSRYSGAPQTRAVLSALAIARMRPFGL